MQDIQCFFAKISQSLPLDQSLCHDDASGLAAHLWKRASVWGHVGHILNVEMS